MTSVGKSCVTVFREATLNRNNLIFHKFIRPTAARCWFNSCMSWIRSTVRTEPAALENHTTSDQLILTVLGSFHSLILSEPVLITREAVLLSLVAYGGLVLKMASCTGGIPSPGPLDASRIESLAQEIHKCVKKDHLVKAKFILKGLKREEKRNIVSKDINGNTPLIIAAQQGHVHFVNYLLDDCAADIEQRGVYEVQEDRSKHLVSPLWCAAVANKFEVVKTLIKHGADVNATSDTQSTPVRSACYMTNIEIVKFLVQHGADIHKPNINGGTCLINSVQSVELCKFLIEKGASLNAQDNSGNLALHYAVREGRIDSVKLLMKYESDPFIKNDFGDDAIQTAALRGYADILDFLVQEINPSIECQIDAYELLGANFIDEKHDIPRALEIWSKALDMRYSNPDHEVPKPVTENPNPAYLDAVEVTSKKDLLLMAGNPEAIHMQALLVRERIVGPDHKDVIFGLMYRGAVYADTHHYQRCVDLWKYAFRLRHERQEPLNNECVFTLQALCKLFWEIYEEHKAGYTTETVRFEDVFQIFEMTVEQVAISRDLIWIRPVYPPLQEEFTILLKLLMHLINLLCFIKKSEEDELMFRRLVHKLIKTNPRFLDQRSVLHVAADSRTSTVLEEYYSMFPSLPVVQLLVECGADTNPVDEVNNTPLHVLCEAYNSALRESHEMDNFESVAQYLISKGGHVDARNKSRVMVGQSLAKIFPKLSWAGHVTLKCWAASKIKDAGIPYTGEVPHTLMSFIELH